MKLKDEEFLNQIRSIPCLACGKQPPSHAHHIKSKGSGGDDSWFNVIPLCEIHHVMGERSESWHAGKISFLKKYPHVLDHLTQLGWVLNEGKLFRKANIDLK